MAIEYREHNRAWWNEAVPFHTNSPFYKTQAFKRGESVLDPIVKDRLGNIRGKRLLHLQCHFGLDTLSIARMDGDVTGLDFSASAIAAARELSRHTDCPASFIEGDVLDPPRNLRDFDVVFASWGAIGWIDDIGRWMRTASDALRIGGRLLLFDGHPAMGMFDDKTGPDGPFVLRHPYDSRDPFVEEVQGTYADPNANLNSRRTFYFSHGLSRILTATINAGFSIQGFEEFDRVPWQGLPQMVQADEFYWCMPAGTPFVPLTFGIRAEKVRARATWR